MARAYIGRHSPVIVNRRTSRPALSGRLMPRPTAAPSNRTERQSAMATMRALRAHTRGGPEVLVYESVPRPTVTNGELLIAVHAAAITFDELAWPETWSAD